MARSMTSREFNRDTAAAKRAAEEGPVVVTDRNRPAHVLLTWSDYRRLVDGAMTPMDVIASAETADVDLPLPPREMPRNPVLNW